MKNFIDSIKDLFVDFFEFIMTWIAFIIPFVIFVVAICYALFFSNSGQQFLKNVKSNWSDLDRNVIVLNVFTGDTLFVYSGPCYFSVDKSGINVSLIYEQNGTKKKANWSGHGFIFQAIEK